MTSLLFRSGAFYFMETAGNLVQGGVSEKFHKELVVALESARMRLSVALAMETKSTPRDRRQSYLETADQMSRFIRKLRTAAIDSMPVPQGWICALDMLKNLPDPGKASRLSQILGDIVMKLG